MFKGLANLAGMVKQVQEMQGKMAEVQESLAKLKFSGSAGGDMVVVESNGLQQVLNCRIDPSLFQTSDREMIEDLIVSATNQSLERAKQGAAEEMSKVAGGLNLPGLQETLSKFGLG